MLSKKEWQKALVERHGERLQQKFEQATVAICGLGGLGSHIALALARAGVGKLILVDFDRVDITNLHRQQYKVEQIGNDKTQALAENIKEIAPYCQVRTYTEQITEENIVDLLKDANVICEAFDKAEEKAMLVNGVLEQLPKTYLVAASGMAGIGASNEIRTRKIMKRFYLCGDEQSEVSDAVTLFAPRVMLCAAHQALAVLRILAEEYEV